MPKAIEKVGLRKELRRRRTALSAQQQRIASMNACSRIALMPEFQFAKRIAAYIPCNGEINPQPIVELAWRSKKQVYLPVLHPFFPGQLLFVEHWQHQPLAKNRYGIPEPINAWGNLCPAWTLNLVLTPLVGFDPQGNRIGMGGGFYDRTFDFLHAATKPGAPSLVGLAHECQKVEALPAESWDIPMKKIVTDGGVY